MSTERKPLEIALLRRRFHPGRGGAENVAAEFVRRFSARGHRISFFGEKCIQTEECQVRWIKVPEALFSSSGTTGFARNSQLTLEPLRERFDIIYSMCRTFPVDVFRVTEQLHTEWLPMAYNPLAMLNPRHFRITRLERHCFRPENVRMVVTNSKLVRNQVLSRFDYPGERIEVIPNGVDHKRFCPAEFGEKERLRQELGIPEDKQVLLFVAAKFKTKRLDLALDALGGLEPEHKRNVVLVVVGGDDPAPYRRRIAASGLEVMFTGVGEDMRSFYCAADLLYYPGLYEPFANVCLEAAACALPVLTTSLNGSSELVESGSGGYLVKTPSDYPAIRAALTDFLSMPEDTRLRMGVDILEKSSGYTWERHAQMLEELFYKVMDMKNNEKKAY